MYIYTESKMQSLSLFTFSLGPDAPFIQNVSLYSPRCSRDFKDVNYTSTTILITYIYIPIYTNNILLQ